MTAQTQPSDLMARNVRNLNTATAGARHLVAAMLDMDHDAATAATDRLLTFIRGLDDDAREQMTTNALTMLVQVLDALKDVQRNG